MKFNKLNPRFYTGQYIENLIPLVRGQSIGTALSWDFTGSSTVALPAGTTINGSSLTALGTITSSSAQALAVGLNGLTNPAFNVDSSTGSQAAGLNVIGATAAGTVAVAVISSGAAANLTLDALGTGTLKLATVSTGNVTIGAAGSSQAIALVSAGASALAVGRLGATTPALKVDASTATSITGLQIKAAGTGGGVALLAIGETNVALKLDSAGTGTLGLNTSATNSGLVTLGNTTSLAGAFVNGPLTYSSKVLASSGNTTITAAMSGAIMLLDGSSVTYTLPVGVVGMTYTFISTVVSNTTQKVITTTGDFFTGTITVSTAAGTPATYMAVGNGSTHLAITQNGTTTGGGVGSIFTVVCYAANKWNAFGQVIGTGSNASPFATS